MGSGIHSPSTAAGA